MEKKNKLLLIDGSSVAFHANFLHSVIKIDRFKNANGLHTNGLWHSLMLSHLLERIQPTHVSLLLMGKTTFRTEMCRLGPMQKLGWVPRAVSLHSSEATGFWESAIVSYQYEADDITQTFG